MVAVIYGDKTLSSNDVIKSAAADHGLSSKNYAYGIVFMLASETFWVGMNAIVKHLSADFPTIQLLFLRNIIPVPCMFILLLVLGNLSALKTNRPGKHVLTGVVGAMGMTALIFSLSQLTLSQVVAITYAAPLMITALSVPMLGEKVGPRRWMSVIVGFIGVLVLARPEIGLDPTVFLVLAGTFCFALVVVIRRDLSRTDDAATIVFYFSLFVSSIASIFLPWHWHHPEPTEWMLLLLMGVLAMGAQFCIMQAIKRAPVSVVAPLLYSSLILAVAIDILYWGIAPDISTIIGAVIIIAAGLYIVYRESGFSRLKQTDNIPS